MTSSNNITVNSNLSLILMLQLSPLTTSSSQGTLQTSSHHNYYTNTPPVYTSGETSQVYITDISTTTQSYITDISTTTQLYTPDISTTTQSYITDISPATQSYISDINQSANPSLLPIEDSNPQRGVIIASILVCVLLVTVCSVLVCIGLGVTVVKRNRRQFKEISDYLKHVSKQNYLLFYQILHLFTLCLLFHKGRHSPFRR